MSNQKKPSLARKTSWYGYSFLFLGALGAGRWYYVFFSPDGRWDRETIALAVASPILAIIGAIIVLLSISVKAGVRVGPDG